MNCHKASESVQSCPFASSGFNAFWGGGGVLHSSLLAFLIDWIPWLVPGLDLSSQAGNFAGVAVELPFLGHAGAMKGEDVLESPSGTTAHRRDRQVRDKEVGAAVKTGPTWKGPPWDRPVSARAKKKQSCFGCLVVVVGKFSHFFCPPSSSPFCFPAVLQQLV